jgi:hypothetical protein
MKYIVTFYGCPKGRLNTAWKQWYNVVVEADSVEEAMLKPYDTHDHLLPSRTAVEEAVPISELSPKEAANGYASGMMVSGDSTLYAKKSWLDQYRADASKA